MRSPARKRTVVVAASLSPLPSVRWPQGEAPRGAETLPFTAWGSFLDRFSWKQGEHVSLIGPTGGGKTTLALAILPMRSYVVVFATKPTDDTMQTLVEMGWHKTETWPPVDPSHRKIILWPPYKKPKYEAGQKPVFAKAFDDIYDVGKWCVYIDEAAYFVDDLKLDRQMKRFWRQGRSEGISLVASTQRPAWVPLDIYSQATHLFFWRTTDERDVDRIAGVGAANSALIKRVIPNLPLHHSLYVNTRTGAMAITRVERT